MRIDMEREVRQTIVKTQQQLLSSSHTRSFLPPNASFGVCVEDLYAHRLATCARAMEIGNLAILSSDLCVGNGATTTT